MPTPSLARTKKARTQRAEKSESTDVEDQETEEKIMLVRAKTQKNVAGGEEKGKHERTTAPEAIRLTTASDHNHAHEGAAAP